MFLLLTSSGQWRRQWFIFDRKRRLGVLTYRIGLHWLVCFSISMFGPNMPSLIVAFRVEVQLT